MLTSSEAIRALAHDLYENRKMRLALAECMKAITVCPVAPWPYLLAGKCHFWLREKRAARGHLTRFIELVKPGLATQATTTEAKRLLAMLEDQE